MNEPGTPRDPERPPDRPPSPDPDDVPETPPTEPRPVPVEYPPVPGPDGPYVVGHDQEEYCGRSA